MLFRSNHKLLDELDKTRKKLYDKTYARISIEYRPRKQNKVADKLSKKGKTEGLLLDKLSKKGQKIGRRKFNGNEIKYPALISKQEIHINVFRKDPVQDEWEIWVEICMGENEGQKFKIYTDDLLAAKLQRGNEYIIRVKKVYTHHVKIFKTINKIKLHSLEN